MVPRLHMRRWGPITVDDYGDDEKGRYNKMVREEKAYRNSIQCTVQYTA